MVLSCPRPCNVEHKIQYKSFKKSIQKQLSNEHPNFDRFWIQLGSILGGFWKPSWSQDRTKSLPKSIPRMIKKMITFWMPLEIDFDQFWLQLGGVLGGPFVYFLGTFSLLGPSWPPKPRQEDPKRNQHGEHFAAKIHLKVYAFQDRCLMRWWIVESKIEQNWHKYWIKNRHWIWNSMF